MISDRVHDIGVETHPSIVIVTYNINNLGGVPKSTSTIANNLHRRGYPVKVVSISPAMIPVSRILDEGIIQFTCNKEVPPTQRFLSHGLGAKVKQRLLGFFKHWRPKGMRLVRPSPVGVDRMAEILTEIPLNRTVMIVTDVNSMDYVNLALKKGSQVRPTIIGQFRGTVEALSPARLQRIIAAYADVDLLLALTGEDAARLKHSTSVLTKHIFNPVPTADPAVLRHPKSSEVVTMGRLAPEKGIDQAIRAWSLIANEYPGWRLRVYGDGPLRGELSEFINTLELEGSVSLEGATDSPLTALQRARIHLLPSQHEGFGMSVAEAATVGTPTLAFDCSPGVRAQIEDGVNGVLVPLNNVKRMGERLSMLIGDEERTTTMGERARESVRRFDEANVMQRWDELIAIAQYQRSQPRK